MNRQRFTPGGVEHAHLVLRLKCHKTCFVLRSFLPQTIAVESIAIYFHCGRMLTYHVSHSNVHPRPLLSSSPDSWTSFSSRFSSSRDVSLSLVDIFSILSRSRVAVLKRRLCCLSSSAAVSSLSSRSYRRYSSSLPVHIRNICYCGACPGC